MTPVRRSSSLKSQSTQPYEQGKRTLPRNKKNDQEGQEYSLYEELSRIAKNHHSGKHHATSKRLLEGESLVDERKIKRVKEILQTPSLPQHHRVTRSAATKMKEGKTLVDTKLSSKVPSASLPSKQDKITAAIKPDISKSRSKAKQARGISEKMEKNPRKIKVPSKNIGTQTSQDPTPQLNEVDIARVDEIKEGSPTSSSSKKGSTHSLTRGETVCHQLNETPIAALDRMSIVQLLKSYEDSAKQNIGQLKKFFATKDEKLLTIQEVNYCSKLLWGSMSFPMINPRKGQYAAEGLSVGLSHSREHVLASAAVPTTMVASIGSDNRFKSIEITSRTSKSKRYKDRSYSEANWTRKKSCPAWRLDHGSRGSSPEAASDSYDEESGYDDRSDYEGVSPGSAFCSYRKQKGEIGDWSKGSKEHEKSLTSTNCKDGMNEGNRTSGRSTTKSNRPGKLIPEFTFEFGTSGVKTPGSESSSSAPMFKFGAKDSDEYYFDSYVEDDDGKISPFRM